MPIAFDKNCHLQAKNRLKMVFIVNDIGALPQIVRFGANCQFASPYHGMAFGGHKVGICFTWRNNPKSHRCQQIDRCRKFPTLWTDGGLMHPRWRADGGLIAVNGYIVRCRCMAGAPWLRIDNGSTPSVMLRAGQLAHNQRAGRLASYQKKTMGHGGSRLKGTHVIPSDIFRPKILETLSFDQEGTIPCSPMFPYSQT
jgi:hypothetical protein